MVFLFWFIGVHTIAYAYPKVKIVTTAVDPTLNSLYHIIPGIGKSNHSELDCLDSSIGMSFFSFYSLGNDCKPQYAPWLLWIRGPCTLFALGVATIDLLSFSITRTLCFLFYMPLFIWSFSALRVSGNFGDRYFGTEYNKPPLYSQPWLDTQHASCVPVTWGLTS